MFTKLNELSVINYIKVKGFIEDFKKEQEGMEIVQTVMITLIGVLAAALLWGLLEEQLKEWWTQITGAASDITSSPE